MSDTTVSTDSTATEGDAPETGAQENVKTTEWYETELSKVRSEAAKYRTQKKEAAEAARTEVTNEFQAKLADAQTAHEATMGELGKAQNELMKLRAALAADVPTNLVSEFASLLQGNSEEEITAHAETVKKLLGASNSRVPAVDPSPSGKGNAMPLNGDPVEDALKAALGIK